MDRTTQNRGIHNPNFNNPESLDRGTPGSARYFNVRFDEGIHPRGLINAGTPASAVIFNEAEVEVGPQGLNPAALGGAGTPTSAPGSVENNNFRTPVRVREQEVISPITPNTCDLPVMPRQHIGGGASSGGKGGHLVPSPLETEESFIFYFLESLQKLFCDAASSNEAEILFRLSKTVVHSDYFPWCTILCRFFLLVFKFANEPEVEFYIKAYFGPLIEDFLILLKKYFRI